MTFPTKDSFTFNHADQVDYPQQSSTQTKINLDARGEELRIALNAVINILNSSVLGSSGAESVGVPETISGSGTTVKSRLEWIYSQLTGIALSEIPNGSVEDIKLANDIKIGSLATLTTTSKDNVTNAINELDATDATLQSNINSVNSAKIDLTQKGIANGVATLGADSLIPTSQIPTLSYIPKSLITAVGDLIIGMGSSNPGILAKGTDGQILKLISGSPAWYTPSVNLNKQIFTSSGTFTAPKAAVYKVTVTGGGGSGGYSLNYYDATGGGGAGTAIKWVSLTAGQNVSVTIGSGGTVPSSYGWGGNGGTSSFGSYCSATGGLGGYGYPGNASDHIGAGGGSGSSGDINMTGLTSCANHSPDSGTGGASYWGMSIGAGGWIQTIGNSGIAIIEWAEGV